MRENSFAVLALFLGGRESYVGFAAGKPDRIARLIAHKIPPPTYCRSFDREAEALKRYSESATDSIKHGWRIVYTGEPNFG